MVTKPAGSSKIGFGIISLGMIANIHAQAIAAVPGAKQLIFTPTYFAIKITSL